MAIVKAYLCPQDLRRDTFSRSALCVGDVVECLNDNGVRQFFLCENVGWSEVDLTSA